MTLLKKKKGECFLGVRIMIKLNEEQSLWMRNNFCLQKQDFPTDFYEIKDFIELICGCGVFRGEDYKGDSHCFVEECLFSLFAIPKNKTRFNKLFLQLENYWIKESLNNEYYELSQNLNTLHSIFKVFVEQANLIQAEYEVNSLLSELGMKENSELLF